MKYKPAEEDFEPIFDDLKYSFNLIREHLLSYKNKLVKINFIISVLQNNFKHFNEIILELYERLASEDNQQAIQILFDIYSYGFYSIPADTTRAVIYETPIPAESKNKNCLIM